MSMGELAAVVKPEDDEAIMWLSLGLPMLGWAPAARGLMERNLPATASIDEWLADRIPRN